MTFKDVAIKNFKANLNAYKAYFLCSSFAIMLFFMYSTLLFNDGLRGEKDYEIISIIFAISMGAVALFSAFFINYAFSAFIRSRQKEFGVYLTLGMTPKDIRRMIRVENLLIIAASLILGLGAGLVFSRLFQMTVIHLLHLKDISYSLDYRCFLITIAVFAFIFGLVLGISGYQTRKLDIADLIRQARKSEGAPSSGLLPGIAGLALLGCSAGLTLFLSGQEELRSNGFVLAAYLSLSFAAVYVTVSGMGGALLGMAKRSPNYYKNLLVVSEIHYKFHSNKRILFVLSLLSSMTVFLVASPYSLYSQSERISGMAQPHHLEYAEVGVINRLEQESIERIVRSDPDNPLTEQLKIEFIILPVAGTEEQSATPQVKPIIPLDAFSSATGLHPALAPGEALNIITAWEPGYHGIEPGSTLTFQSDRGQVSYRVADSIHETWVTGATVFPSDSGIVLNREDYDLLKRQISAERLGTFHIFSFRDWKAVEPVARLLQEELDAAASGGSSADRGVDEAGLYKAASRWEQYNGLKDGYAMFIFVTTVMGLLFFVAAGSVLYFKQYTELGAAKAKFFKLYKLGIQEKEAAAVIGKELQMAFFTPLVLGSFLGYSFMYLMTHLVGGEEVIGDFMLNATGVIAVYFLFQTVFYAITKRKFVREVLGEL